MENPVIKKGKFHDSTNKDFSLRDYFAAKAMQGLVSDPSFVTNPHSRNTYEETVAESSYQIADAMLKERQKS